MSFATFEYATSPWADGLTIEVGIPPVGPPPVDPGPARPPPITGLRIMTPIPAFPQYPSRADPPEEFMIEGDAFLAHFPTFRSAANVLSTEMDAAAAATALHEAYATDAAVSAASSALAASGVANFKGNWSSLAGALAIPASVAHLGQIWVLTESLANVALEAPGGSTKWILAYPVRKFNLFEVSGGTLQASSSGEEVYTDVRLLDLASSAQVTACGTGAFAVTSSAASSTLRVSLDNGLTWVSKALPASSVWRVVGHSAGFVAFAEGATGANATAISNDNGATWTAQAFAGPLGASTTRYAADPGGSLVVAAASTGTTLYVSANNGATWSAVQSAPITPVSVFITGGVIFIKAAGTSYYTSLTGLTGSWTLRTMPAGASGVPCDTWVMTEGQSDSLLAYKAGSLFENVYSMTDAINQTWTVRPQRLWLSASSLRLIRSTLLTSSGGGPLECATARTVGSDTRWVPRSAPFAIATTRHVAHNGVSAIVLANNASYRSSTLPNQEPTGRCE